MLLPGWKVREKQDVYRLSSSVLFSPVIVFFITHFILYTILSLSNYFNLFSILVIVYLILKNNFLPMSLPCNYK